jgi:histidinol-phosphate aminotransferase
VGEGAAQLLGAAAQALLEPHDELVTPWPSYGLYPIIARRARGHAVPVPGFGADAVLRAINERTRLVALCNPNDPTGELIGVAELRSLLAALPERVVVLLDEALVEYAPASAFALLEDHPRLLVFRSFSKAWGLAGLRIGYALGAPGSGDLLAELAPDLGVSEISQAGALEALRSCTELVDRHVAAIREERPRLTAELRGRGFEVSDSQAHFLWAAHPALDGSELAASLAQAGVLVAAGDALGEPRHVRVSVRSRAASDRLLDAIDKAI